MRALYVILGLLFTLLVAASVAGAWAIRHAHQRRDQRIATLEATLPAPRMADPLDADQACAILEYQLLTRPIDRALSVDCKAAKLDLTGRGVVRLAGTIYASSVDNALLGGGFGTPHCLALSEDGWAVVGQAWRMDECVFDAEGGSSADAIAAAAGEMVAARHRAIAEHAIFGVRQALARSDSVPAVCEGLEPTSGKAVGLVDVDVWSPEGFGEQGGFWRNLTSPTFTACVDGEEPSKYSLGCGLDEPWRYVLVLDAATKAAPQAIGHDQFIGGDYQATLKLVDMNSPRVICARPVQLSLDGTVLLATGDWIANHYHQRIQASLCEEVEQLTHGKVALDPYWACD